MKNNQIVHVVLTPNHISVLDLEFSLPRKCKAFLLQTIFFSCLLDQSSNSVPPSVSNVTHIMIALLDSHAYHRCYDVIRMQDVA